MRLDVKDGVISPHICLTWIDRPGGEIEREAEAETETEAERGTRNPLEVHLYTERMVGWQCRCGGARTTIQSSSTCEKAGVRRLIPGLPSQSSEQGWAEKRARKGEDFSEQDNI